ncbi:DUF4252 domain-containing protein [Leptobacterium flavescens]|uniref:DUF4252 domain-containing protein n=1 Tax=Leptobacterium flavescens TaxID=472055 RepID=A0A6P0UH63_9FLAO|nr:DUF4252 domain-containing protein [Leptobacterium flavescens]NER11972.1 DUF4252 domain-containing protein [Leptobacterium flavescens]
MKKVILIILIAVMPLVGFSQSIFDKYENHDEVAFVSISPKMFKLLSGISAESDDPEAQAFFDLVNSITSFKVITTEDGPIAKDIQGWVSSHLRSASLDELMRVREGDSNVRIYVQEGKDEHHVKELLMIVTGMKDVNVNGKNFETVLLSLTGNIDLRKIGELTDKMDIPGGKQLKKASKNR